MEPMNDIILRHVLNTCTATYKSVGLLVVSDRARIARNWVWAGIALIAVGSKPNRHQGLRTGDDYVGNSVRRAVIDSSKIRMQTRISVDARDDLIRIGIDWSV